MYKVIVSGLWLILCFITRMILHNIISARICANQRLFDIRSSTAGFEASPDAWLVTRLHINVRLIGWSCYLTHQVTGLQQVNHISTYITEHYIV